MFNKIPKPEIPVGGRLKYFITEWYKITTDPQIINMVKGCDIPLDKPLPSVKPKPDLIRNKDEIAFAKLHIQELLDKNAIVECSREDGDFVSSVFLVPKRQGLYRMVLDLANFNKFASKSSFKMETFHTILSMVSPNMYMTNIDLLDAYLTVAMSISASLYLKFTFQNRLFKYIVLPFGYTGSPKIFTKLLRPIIARLRKLGLLVSFYLDDSWQGGSTYSLSLRTCATTFNTLLQFGFLPNLKKSQLIPAQQIVILGAVIDSVKMIVYLPKEKEEKVILLIRNTLKMKYMTIRHLARVIGKLISCTVACPLGNAYFRCLERLKVRALNLHKWRWNCRTALDQKSINELNWWLTHLPGCSAPIVRPVPTRSVFSDACNYGWSMVYKNYTAHGFFSEKEKDLSINTKETLAILYGFLSLKEHLMNSHIHFQSDSTVAISYVKKFGGMNSELRSNIVRDLWNNIIKCNSWGSISHIPGVDNIDADIASRVLCERTQWTINSSIFEKVCEHFNLSPSVDLFGSRLNFKVNRYFSYTPDPFCAAVDSFTQNWSGEKLCYLFPPFNLLPRCLSKLKQEKVHKALLICPAWPNQPFFGMMLNMLIDYPVISHTAEAHVLTLPWCSTRTHPNSKNLKLLFTVVSGTDILPMEFQSILSPALSSHGVPRPDFRTLDKLKDGTYFVVNDKLIPCTHLNQIF